MINKTLPLFLVLTGLLLSACVKTLNLYTSDEIMEEFEPKYLEFDYLTAKGRIVLEESNGKSTKGTINLRAKKDSIIWFSVTPGLGLEAIRGSITKDRIKIKDRLNGEDINMSYQEIAEKYNLQLSLDLLENLVYANIPHEFSYRDRLVRIGRYFELSQVRDSVRYHARVATTHGKVVELSSNPLNNKGGLTASYPIFENVEGEPFPSKVLLKLSFLAAGSIQGATVHLEFSKVEKISESLSFPFQF